MAGEVRTLIWTKLGRSNRKNRLAANYMYDMAGEVKTTHLDEGRKTKEPHTMEIAREHVRTCLVHCVAYCVAVRGERGGKRD